MDNRLKDKKFQKKLIKRIKIMIKEDLNLKSFWAELTKYIKMKIVT